MHFNLLIFLTFLSLSFFSGWYILAVIRKRHNRRWLQWLHIVLSVSAVAGVLPMSFVAHGKVSDSAFATEMWLLVYYLSIVFSQIVFIVFDLAAKIPCLFGKKRIKVLSYVGIALGSLTFLTIWWGALINRYRLDVVPVEVSIQGLPDSFDGYTIVQISDLHVGSYAGDTTFVSRMVDRINELRPDLIVFTGDLVNRHSLEAEPFMPVLSRLSAPDGQFAVLGNHDYADYFYSTSEIDKKLADRRHLHRLYAGSSLRLLSDEHVILRRGNDSIALIGVQNIGTDRFPAYGSLNLAYPDISDSTVKILLSHDPAHWHHDIADNTDSNIALTLSGHTHAMQTRIFGISPASMIYDNYEGLHADKAKRQQLYINIGIGTVGTPMRIGATPEITFITLKKESLQ